MEKTWKATTMTQYRPLSHHHLARQTDTKNDRPADKKDNLPATVVPHTNTHTNRTTHTHSDTHHTTPHTHTHTHTTHTCIHSANMTPYQYTFMYG